MLTYTTSSSQQVREVSVKIELTIAQLAVLNMLLHIAQEGLAVGVKEGEGRAGTGKVEWNDTGVELEIS